MKKFLILLLIIILQNISIIFCDITIIGPNELSSQFNNKPIEMIFDKIGKSSYDFYTRGELYLNSDNSRLEACQNLPPINPEISNKSQESFNFKILIAKRGLCSFVQKARNAQMAGYSMIIIVNNMKTDIKDVIMSDDGSGNDIHIPIAMISLEDGNKIIKFLEKNKTSKIIVEINFSQKKENLEKIDVKIFFSSSELRAYQLFNNLAQYIHKFDNQVNFIPIYVVHRAPFYNPDNPIRTINCVSNGKYCYFPKETTITKDGQAIIMEDLRQKCLYDISKKSNNLFYYFTYLKDFYSECLTKDKIVKFNDNCAKSVLRTMRYPVGVIDSCIAQSYEVKDLLSNLYIDKENIILKNEYEELLKYKLTSFPAVIINNKPLNGVIKETKIINEICSLIKNKNDFCLIMTGNGNNKKKVLVYVLIFVLILVNIFIFFIFRKYIIERINERISQGGLDLDSRIKNVIGNYFSLNKINNDYTRMQNNPTSSIDLQNQKGKVVDIAVEMT